MVHTHTAPIWEYGTSLAERHCLEVKADLSSPEPFGSQGELIDGNDLASVRRRHPPFS